MLVPRRLSDSYYARGILSRFAELGYRDGVEMTLHYRSADGVADRFPALADELIREKCDVILAIGSDATALALRRAPMPVVFLAVDYDPVAKGVVSSLRSPGGNLTGVYVPQNELVAKRLELMREVMPHAGRFLVLADVFSRNQVAAARAAAERVGVELTVVEFSRRPYDYAAAFEQARKVGAGALVGLASPVFSDNGAAIAEQLGKHRLPAVGSSVELAQAGYLLGFGPDNAKVARRTAELAVRILEGMKPSDSAVESADEFELAVNASTARQLGLKIPESVLARATRIVQ